MHALTIAPGFADGPATLGRVTSEPPVASLDAFLASVEQRALRIAQVATRDRDEALDLVQDAMLQLARRYARRPAAEWPPLFYRILGNRIRDWQRHQTVRNRVLSRDDSPADAAPAIDQHADPQAHGEAVLQREQAVRRLEAALRELPERQRQAFELRLWHGLSVEDAAQAMGCSAGSVKTHLFRALATLRGRLGDVWS